MTEKIKRTGMMLRRVFTLTLMGLFVSASILVAKPRTVTGRVFCGGEPVSDAVLSDGIKVVTTDKNGKYSLKSDFIHGYIFLSIPSGYDVARDGLIPRHFVTLPDETSDFNADFELFKTDNSKCKLLIVNDIHLTNDQTTHDIDQFRTGALPDLLSTIEGFGGKKAYMLTLGDMTTDSRWYRQKFALPDYLKEMESIPIPIFHSMGNHDNDIRGGGGDWKSAGAYRRIIGPNYYSYNIGEFHIVVLDNIVYDNPLNAEGQVASVTAYHTYITRDQLLWLQRDLAHVSKDTPLIVYAHSPFYRYRADANGVYTAVESVSKGHSIMPAVDILRKFDNVYILSGHTHLNYYVQITPNILEHNCTALAGASWTTKGISGLNMSKDGVPAGYAVYEIDGKDLRWYYKATGMKKEECQFRSYDMNTVGRVSGWSTTPNEVVINIFNWDPEWKVSVSENGTELPVTRVWIKDPLYRYAVDPNMTKTTFRSIENSHMFSVQAATPDATLTIEVTDRFGEVYTETMTRPKEFSATMYLGNR